MLTTSGGALSTEYSPSCRHSLSMYVQQSHLGPWDDCMSFALGGTEPPTISLQVLYIQTLVVLQILVALALPFTIASI